ncbi:MAG: RNA polymerase sigma factor [Caulobacteraceae bacterium]
MRAEVGGQGRAVARSDSRDDARLIAKIAQGDLRAFDALYRTYHARLTRFLVGMVHRSQMVEEVLDDTMLVVWNRPDTYNGASKVSTWIFAIAYRKALNAMRRQDEPIEDTDAENRASDDASPEQLLGQRQVREALSSAMGELSADHRVVVDLAYFHELEYREIAEIMSCPEDTVKTRMCQRVAI